MLTATSAPKASIRIVAGQASGKAVASERVDRSVVPIRALATTGLSLLRQLTFSVAPQPPPRPAPCRRYAYSAGRPLSTRAGTVPTGRAAACRFTWSDLELDYGGVSDYS